MYFVLKIVLICVLLSLFCPNIFVNNKDIDYSPGLCATRPTSFQVLKSISVGDSLLLSVKLPDDPEYRLVRTKYYRSEDKGIRHEGDLFRQFVTEWKEIHTKSNWFTVEFASPEFVIQGIPDFHYGKIYWSEVILLSINYKLLF